jgi:hypothetical protein
MVLSIFNMFISVFKLVRFERNVMFPGEMHLSTLTLENSPQKVISETSLHSVCCLWGCIKNLTLGKHYTSLKLDYISCFIQKVKLSISFVDKCIVKRSIIYFYFKVTQMFCIHWNVFCNGFHQHYLQCYAFCS